VGAHLLRGGEHKIKKAQLCSLGTTIRKAAGNQPCFIVVLIKLLIVVRAEHSWK